MKVEQIYTGCLAQGAYYIESEGEVAIIDPMREVQPYIDKVEAENAKIKYVFETHFHADFVSGHVDLARATGATIVYGPNATTKYDTHIAKDGEEFTIGKVKIRVLHTPGHTLESTTYLLLDEEGKEHAIFSGDTLFLGDVGRPDLAVKSDLTQAELAAILFDSLRNKIMPLPDEVIVYPGHGAGSACGKNMRKETVGSIGEEKRTNYALRADMPKEEFVKEVTEGLAPPPAYFPKNALMNMEGYESITEVLDRGLQALSPGGFEAAANERSALMLDTRDPETFAKAFIPNSINIGIDGNFAPWVGALILEIKQPILIIAESGREEETVTRLARVGCDQAIGYLKGGVDAWQQDGRPTDSIESISPAKFAEIYHSEDPLVIDVRKPSEYEAEYVKGAKNLPLDFINENMQSFTHDTPQYIHCAGGYRSMIASSILKARGFENVINVQEGFKGISETDIPTTEFVCPSTLK